MIKIAAGAVFGFELLFADGQTPATITYTVRGNDNLPIVGLTNLTATVPAAALSTELAIPPSGSVIGSGYFEMRTLSWAYDTKSGSVRYRVDALLPFGVSEEGVRTKLGVMDDELDPGDIDLTAAYLKFATPLVAQASLTAAATAGDLTTIKIVDAVEATAALQLLPSLQLKLAKTRSSGTNKFDRQTAPDWEMLREYLAGLVAAGAAAIDVPSDAFGGTGFLLAFSTRVDPITNS